MTTKKKTTSTKTKFKPVNKRKFFPSKFCNGFVSLEVTEDAEDMYSVDFFMSDGSRSFNPFSYFIMTKNDLQPLRGGLKVMKEYMEAYEAALDNIEACLSKAGEDKAEQFKKENI